MANIHNTPQCVIQDFLYISSARNAKNKTFLEQEQISVIVNASTETKNHFPETIQYHNISIPDDPSVDVSAILRSIPAHVESARLSDKRVLIHCAAGVSRSATLVLAYLITFRGMTLRQAHEVLKEARPVIRPNNGFWRQLIDLEREIRGGETTIAMVQVNGELIPDIYPKKSKTQAENLKTE